MLTGFNAGVSGIYYNEQKMAVTSHNLANVDTSGFRNSYLMMRSREAHDLSSQTDSSIKKRLPPIYGSEPSGVYRSFTETGALKETGSPLDIAIPSEHGNAFFAVKRADPMDQETYFTRNGRLQLGPMDPANPNGPTVIRMAGHIALDANMQPIIVDPAAGPLQINGDGEVRQGETVIGQIPVFRMDGSADPAVMASADLQKLIQLGDSIYQIPKEHKDEFHAHQLQVGQAGVHRTVIQGMREQSNVNIFHELVDMMNATKGIGANQSAMARQLDSLTKLFTLVQK